MLSAIIRGGESVGCSAAQGFSDVRRVPRVEITASWLFAVEAVVMALTTSEASRGDPRTRVTLDFCVGGTVERKLSSEEGLRTSAVTMCPRRRASSRTRVPVRPVAPMMRICILVLCSTEEVYDLRGKEY